MNLYKLTQEDNDGYDTYDSCIVAAENEERAKLIHPCLEDSNPWTPNLFDWAWNRKDSVWADKPENVTAELIGIAIDGTESGVILSSFNAA